MSASRVDTDRILTPKVASLFPLIGEVRCILLGLRLFYCYLYHKSRATLNHVLARLEVTVADDGQRDDVEGMEDRCARRRVAEIGAANVAGFDHVWTGDRHGAARAVGDARLVDVRCRALTYHDSVAIFSFHDFPANRLRRVVNAAVADFRVESRLMFGDVHRVTA